MSFKTIIYYYVKLYIFLHIQSYYLNSHSFQLHPSLSLSTPFSSQLYQSQTTTNNNDNDNDNDINSYEYYRPQSRNKPQGGDMAYTDENVRRSALTFQSIRNVGGVDCTNDVYARGKNR